MVQRAASSQGDSAIAVLRFAEIDSTSAYARKLAQTGQLRRRPAMIVAERQTAGVGRFRRQWSSPTGGLWCTLAWPLEPGAAGEGVLEGLGLRVGLACMDVVEGLLSETKRPTDVRLKWPNDVMVNGRKVAGVLCEIVSGSLQGIGISKTQDGSGSGADRYLLIGVGLNANVSSVLLPSEIREKAAGLLDHLARPLDLEMVRERVQAALVMTLRTRGVPTEILRRARERLYGLGSMVSVALPHGQKVFGELIGLNEYGMAQLRTDHGPYVAPSGTVIMVEDA